MSAVENYLQAHNEYTEAEQQAGRIVKKVESVASALRRWDFVIFSNTGFSAPAEIVLNPNNPSISPTDYPSFDELWRTIQKYHDAKAMLLKAWGAVPENQRGGLVKPPGR